MTRRNAQETNISYLIVLIACIIVCGPLLLTDEVFYFRDHSLIFRRLLHEVSLAYSQFRFPLWDAMAGAGEPLAAYPAGLSYSPLMPLMAIGDLDTAYRWFVVAHIPLAAIGAYFLGSSMKLRPYSSAGVSIAYALGGSYLAYNNLLPAFESATFGPWVIAFALRITKSPSPINAAVFSAALAFHVMVGDPVFLVVDLFVFIIAWWPASISSKQFKQIGLLLLLAGLAAAFSAIAIVPLLELLSNSPRGAGFEYDKLSTFSVQPARLAELFLPGWSGDAVSNETLFSPQNDGRLYLYSIYAGASALPLYLLALHVKAARKWVVLAIVFLVMSLGKFTPLHQWIVESIPGLSSSRYPVKFMYGTQLCLAAILGYALNELPQFNKSRLKQYTIIPLLICVLLASLPLILSYDWLEGFLAPHLSLEAGFSHIAAAASTGVVLMIVSGAILLTKKPQFLLLLLALDLGVAGHRLFPLAPQTIYQTPPVHELITKDTTHPSVFLYNYYQGPKLIEKPSTLDSTYHQLQRLTAGVGVPLGVRYIFDPNLNQVRPQAWLDIETQFKQFDEPRRIALLGRLGVTHLLIEAGQANPPGLINQGTAPVHGGDPITAFKLKQSRPLVMAVPNIVTAQDRNDALQKVSFPSFLTETVIEESIISEFDLPYKSMSLQGAKPRLSETSHQPGNLQTTVTSTVPSIVVFAQSYNQDWIATIDQESTSVFPVDLLMTGVLVPAGTHNVQIRYQPQSWNLGASVSAVAALLMLMLMIRGLTRTRSMLLPSKRDEIKL